MLLPKEYYNTPAVNTTYNKVVILFCKQDCIFVALMTFLFVLPCFGLTISFFLFILNTFFLFDLLSATFLGIRDFLFCFGNHNNFFQRIYEALGSILAEKNIYIFLKSKILNFDKNPTVRKNINIRCT